MRIFVTMVFCLYGTLLAADGRFALVIGNGAYESAGRLVNPVNDAQDMARALEKNGYEVSLHIDADHLTMSRALRSFRRDSRTAAHALIYFAGHGAAPLGTSYVLPVDAQIAAPDDLEIEAIDLETLTAHVAHASELGLIILDACRDSPALTQMVAENRSLSRGLARATPRGGTLIAYATEAGAVAADGSGRNSPYTAALLQTLEEPGLEIGFFFRKVRDRVMAATGGQQRPDHYSALPARQIYFQPPTDAPSPDREPPEVERPGLTVSESALDLTFWQGAMAGGDVEDFEDYLKRFPNGQYASLAKRRVAKLRQAQVAPPVNPPPATLQPLAPKPTAAPTGRWFVILGSYPKSELPKAQARNALLRQQGVGSTIIDSNAYQNLSNGLFVVVVGPMSKSEALTEERRLETVIPDAYIKKGS